MKFSLLTLFLLLLAIGGAIGTVIGLIARDASSIVFGYVLMMVGTGAFVASTWRDETNFSKHADKAGQPGED